MVRLSSLSRWAKRTHSLEKMILTHADLLERDDVVRRRFQISFFRVPIGLLCAGVSGDEHAAGRSGVAGVLALGGEVTIEHSADGGSGHERVDERDEVEGRDGCSEDPSPVACGSC